MDIIKLNTNKYFKDRVKKGYLWIFSNEIEMPNVKKISLVEVYDDKSNFIGMGVFNPHSLISVRILSKERKTIDKNFFINVIKNSLDYRKKLNIDTNYCRLVYGESDFLPGVVIDRYKNVFVIQFFSYAMELLFKEFILEALVELFTPDYVVIRNDFYHRELENAPLGKEVCYSKNSNKNDISLQEIYHFNAKFLVDVINGQKTGFYYDHLENRKYVYAISKDKKILDLCCYTGSFSIIAALGGAKHVVGVDSSSTSVSLAKENAKINNVKNIEFINEDVENFVKYDKEKYDIIIFDPPSYAKSKKDIKNAKKKYISMLDNIKNLLSKDGIMCFSVCSRHIDMDIIKDIIKSSILKNIQNLFIIYYGTQSLDHPIYMPMEYETKYLKFISFRLIL